MEQWPEPSSQNRPFDTAQGSNRFLFVNDTNAQDSQFVAMPPATSAPSKSRSLASYSCAMGKKETFAAENICEAKGSFTQAPYAAYTAVQRNRAKTDPSIKEETLKAGWTKEVKNQYTSFSTKS